MREAKVVCIKGWELGKDHSKRAENQIHKGQKGKKINNKKPHQ